MAVKLREIVSNNIYMLNLVWKNSKIYFFIFVGIILTTYIKDIVLIVAPKYIFDAMQYGGSFKEIVLPVLVYVSL